MYNSQNFTGKIHFYWYYWVNAKTYGLALIDITSALTRLTFNFFELVLWIFFSLAGIGIIISVIAFCRDRKLFCTGLH
jgi:hypothetical protein